MKTIALTFDDGPCELDIPLLITLAEYKVPATFFCVGLALEAHPEIAKEIVTRGHVIGNHSYSHPDLTALSLPMMEEEIEGCQMAAGRALGFTPTLFRAPYVKSNPAIKHAAEKRGLREVGYHAAGHDWRPGYTANDIVENVFTELGRGESGIILLHDTVAATREATQRIIESYHICGYTFVPLRELPDAE